MVPGYVVGPVPPLRTSWLPLVRSCSYVLVPQEIRYRETRGKGGASMELPPSKCKRPVIRERALEQACPSWRPVPIDHRGQPILPDRRRKPDTENRAGPTRILQHLRLRSLHAPGFA